jgi:hypothetical protein
MPEANEPQLILDRFCGREVHPITAATWSLYQDDDADQMTLTVRIEAGAGTGLHADTEQLRAEPWWEINIVEKDLPRSAIREGAKFSIPDGYDDDRGGHLTNFYYCEHESSEANQVEVLAVDGDKILLRVSGETIDVNFYDGSKAPTRLLAEAWFSYNAATVRSMS